jgi:hypothetical protein
MYTGEFWLDYNDGDDEEHWYGRVTRCIVRDDQIALDFSGQDPDYGAFLGNCNLRKQGALFIGGGSFTVAKESGTATVSVTFSQSGKAASLAGSWQDTGDSSAYDLSIELIAI